MDARRWVLTTVMLSVGVMGLAGCASVAETPASDAAAMPLDPYVAPADAPAQPSTPEEAVAARSATENAVAACMAERGFHYVPYVPVGTSAEYAPASRAWSERWGYGVVAQFAGPATDPDPNQAIEQSLSAADRTAWDAALNGTPQTVLPVPPEPLPSEAVEPDVGPQPSAATEWVPGPEPTIPGEPAPLFAEPAPTESAGTAVVGTAEVGTAEVDTAVVGTAMVGTEPAVPEPAEVSTAMAAAQREAESAASVAALAEATVAMAMGPDGTPVVPSSAAAGGPTEVTAWATAGLVDGGQGPDGAPTGAVVQAIPAPGGPATTRATDGCRAKAETTGEFWVAYTPLDGGTDPWAVRALVSQEIDQDPAVVAAAAVWSQCLTDSGHPGMATTPDPVTSIVSALTALSSSPDGSAPDPTALESLRVREVALAVADHDCRESSGLTAARTSAQRSLEQQYVDTHQAELEPYRQAVNGGG